MSFFSSVQNLFSPCSIQLFITKKGPSKIIKSAKDKNQPTPTSSTESSTYKLTAMQSQSNTVSPTCNKCYRPASLFSTSSAFATWWCVPCDEISYYKCIKCGHGILPCFTGKQSMHLYLKRHLDHCAPNLMTTHMLHRCKCRNVLFVQLRPADPLVDCDHCHAKYFKCTQCDKGIRSTDKHFHVHLKEHQSTTLPPE